MRRRGAAAKEELMSARGAPPSQKEYVRTYVVMRSK